MAGKCVECNNCGHIGYSVNRGSFAITIVLAFFFLVPAIIYEIWRNSGLGVCANCGSSLIKPSNQCDPNSTKIKIDDSLVRIVLMVSGVILAFFAVIYGVIFALKSYSYVQEKYFPTEGQLVRQCKTDGSTLFSTGKLSYRELITENDVQRFIDKACQGSKDGKFPQDVHPEVRLSDKVADGAIIRYSKSNLSRMYQQQISEEGADKIYQNDVKAANKVAELKECDKVEMAAYANEKSHYPDHLVSLVQCQNGNSYYVFSDTVTKR